MCVVFLIHSYKTHLFTGKPDISVISYFYYTLTLHYIFFFLQHNDINDHLTACIIASILIFKNNKNETKHTYRS